MNKKEENIAKFGENEGILVKILQKDQLTSYKKPASSQWCFKDLAEFEKRSWLKETKKDWERDIERQIEDEW